MKKQRRNLNKILFRIMKKLSHHLYFIFRGRQSRTTSKGRTVTQSGQSFQRYNYKALSVASTRVLHHRLCAVQYRWHVVSRGLEKKGTCNASKSSYTEECSDYQTIARISHNSKFLLLIWFNLTKMKIADKLPECSSDYRGGWDTNDFANTDRKDERSKHRINHHI